MPDFFSQSDAFAQTWLPFIYLYGVGGLFFASGMIIIVKSRSLNMKRKHHRFWFRTLIGGFLFFMILHAALIISALYL